MKLLNISMKIYNFFAIIVFDFVFSLFTWPSQIQVFNSRKFLINDIEDWLVYKWYYIWLVYSDLKLVVHKPLEVCQRKGFCMVSGLKAACIVLYGFIGEKKNLQGEQLEG